MRLDGFYLSAGSGLLPGLPRLTSDVRYDSVTAALSGDGVLVDAETGALVLRFEAGLPVEVFIRSGCPICEAPAAPFTMALVAFCTSCLPTDLQGPELTVEDLEALFGLPVSLVPLEVWHPLRQRFLQARSALNQPSLQAHLEVLKSPGQLEGWVLLHGDDKALCVSLLSRMYATGSILLEHRPAAAALAREARPLLEALLSSPQLREEGERGFSLIELFLELAATG